MRRRVCPGLASETGLAAEREPLAPELGRFRPVPKRSRGELRSSSEQLKPGRVGWYASEAGLRSVGEQRRGAAPHAPNNAGHRRKQACSTDSQRNPPFNSNCCYPSGSGRVSVGLKAEIGLKWRSIRERYRRGRQDSARFYSHQGGKFAAIRAKSETNGCSITVDFREIAFILHVLALFVFFNIRK